MFNFYCVLIYRRGKKGKMYKVKFPLSIMASGQWNILDDTGKRVAICGLDEGGNFKQDEKCNGEHIAEQIVSMANTAHYRAERNKNKT